MSEPRFAWNFSAVGTPYLSYYNEKNQILWATLFEGTTDVETAFRLKLPWFVT